MIQKKQLVNIAFIAGLFSILLYLCSCFPLTGDDMTLTQEKSGSFKEIFDYAYNFGNGRYLGNMGVLILVTNSFLRIIVKASCLTGLILLFKSISEKKGLYSYIVSAAVILTMPVSIFRQAFVWTAGFQNYFPPVLLFFFCIFIIKTGVKTQHKYIKMFLYLIVSVCSLAAQFYVENSTIFNIAAAAAFALYIFKTNRKKYKIFALLTLIFSSIGVILMFMHKRTAFVDQYRKSYFDSVQAFFSGFSDNMIIASDTFRQGIVLWIIFSFFAIKLMREKSFSKPFLNRLNPIFKIIIYSFPVYCTAELFLAETSVTLIDFRKIFGLIFSLIYLSSLMIIILILSSDKMTMRLFLSAIFSIAPLLVVFPVDSRCFLLSYCLFAFCAGRTVSHINLKKFLSGALTVMMICFTFVYTDISFAYKTREEYIQKKREERAQIIVIPTLPHGTFIHFDVDSFTFSDFHYYYYEEPGDIQFLVTDWQKWRDYIKKENL